MKPALFVFPMLVAISAGTIAAQPPGRAVAPRIEPLPEAQWTAAHRALVAQYRPDRPVGNDLRTFLRHPALVTGVMPFANYVSRDSTLPARDRELLILRTAWLCRSEYIWAQHSAVARSIGITDRERRAIAQGPSAGGWTGFDAALLAAADELHDDSFVSDATWRALAARYDRLALMDAVFAIAEFTMLAGTVNSAGVPLDDGWTDRLPGDVTYTPRVRNNGTRLAKARIDPIPPSAWTAGLRAMLDPSGSGRPVMAIYRTFAHHETLYPPRQLLSEYIRLQASLPARTRELLILRIGALCRAEYEWAAHARAGRAAGLTEAEILRLAAVPDPGGDAADGVLIRAVDELYRDDVISSATWSALAARLDERQLLDVLITTGGYRMVSMSLNTFGVQLEAGSERFPDQTSR